MQILPTSIPKPGTKVRVIANLANHNTPIGTKLTVKSATNGCIQVMETPMNYMTIGDLETLTQTKEFLKEEIKKLAKKEGEIVDEIEDLENRLLWLDETQQEEFDPDQYKIYIALKTLKNTDNLVEASQIIAKLLKE